MDFLKFLEGLRTPFLDSLFLSITNLGSETAFLVIGILFFWCISKKRGYYLLTVGLFGIVINQFLKIVFRIPRPWVRDKEFTVVEGAKADAGGYSFPSGHTQNSVGIFGAIAYTTKRLWVRILCIAAIVLIPFSRMYLGVHTPLDVGVSAVIALILVFGIYPIIKAAVEKPKYMHLVFGILTVFSVAFLLFISFYTFPIDAVGENLESAARNAYKMLGCTLGVWLGYELDRRYVNFDTQAVWWVQIIKFAIGLLLVLGIKALKQPLYMLIPSDLLADLIRYFLITVFTCCVWPLTFNYFAKLGNKK